MTDQRCTCDDEFQTAPCPVHSVEAPPSADFGGEKVSTITDAMMVPDRIRMWEGFIFRCPHCHMDSIMVNSDTCPAGVAVCSNGTCGRKSMIKSHVVTEFVRQLQQKGAK